MTDDLFPTQPSHFMVLLAPLGVNSHIDDDAPISAAPSAKSGTDAITGWKASPAIQKVQGLQLPETTFRQVGDSVNNKIVPMPSQVKNQQELVIVSNIRIKADNSALEGNSFDIDDITNSTDPGEYKYGTMKDWLDWYQAGRGAGLGQITAWRNARRAGVIYLLNFGKVVMKWFFMDGVLNAPQFTDLDALDSDNNMQVTCRINCVMEKSTGGGGLVLPLEIIDPV